MLVDAKTIREMVLKLPNVNPNVLPDGVTDPELLLKAVLKRLGGDMETSRTKMQKAQTLSQKFEKNMRSLEMSIEGIETSKEDLRKQLQKYMKHNANLEAKIAFLGNRWETLTGEVNDMITEDANARIRHCIGEVNVAKEEAFDLKLQQAKSARDIATLKASLADAEEMNARWTDELIERRKLDETSDARIAELVTTVGKLQKELAETKATLANTEKERSAVGSKLSTTQGRLTEVEKKKDALDKAFVKKSRELSSTEDLWHETEAVVGKSVNEKKNLQDDLSAALAEIKSLKTELTTTKKKLSDAEQRGRNTEEKFERVQTDLSAVRMSYRESNTSLTQTGSDLRASKVSNEAANAEIELLRGVVYKLQKDLKDCDGKRLESVDDGKRLTKELQATRAELRESHEKAKELDDEADKMRSELVAFRRDLKYSKKNAIQLSSDLRHLTQKHDATEAEKQERGSLITTIAEDLTKRQGQLDVAQQEIKKLTDALEATKRKLKEATETANSHEADYLRTAADLKNARASLKESALDFRKIGSEKRNLEANLRRVGDDATGVGRAYEEVAAELKERRLDLQEERSKNARLVEQLETTKALLKQAETENAEVEKAREQALEHNREMRLHIRGIDAARTKTQTELKGAEKIVEGTKDDLSHLHERYSKLGDDYKRTKRDLSETQGAVSRLTKDLAETKEALANMRRKASNLEEDNTKLSLQLKAARDDRVSSNARLDDLHAVVKASKSQLTLHEQEACAAKATAAARIDETEFAETRYKDAEGNVQSLTKDLKETRGRLRATEEKLVHQTYLVGKLTPALETSERRLKEAEGAVKKLTVEMRAVKAKEMEAEKLAREEKENVMHLIDELKRCSSPSSDMASSQQTPVAQRRQSMKKAASALPWIGAEQSVGGWR
eukprot:TRINITY_DN50704_c0_g1_i1.p1 TRINITY_DN50704_c0_g1~~TRINITY_DN50704_c0_g1_i1.p1  ORF type:complete len:908 (-),score=239.06 TRINITY_DN50704_c0_g1_i1:38-2761(-)